MRFIYDSTGGQQWKKPFPLFGNATDIAAGAAIILGGTQGTNQGYGVIMPANTSLASGLFLGVTESKFAASVIDNDVTAATKYILTDLTINPHAVWEAQYDNTLTGARWTTGLTLTAVTTGTPSVTITSLETISGGWLFFDNGEIHYVASVAGGVATLKSATTAAITTANKALKIPQITEPLLTFNTAGTKISGGTAAQGAVQMSVLENFIRAVGFDNVMLDPTKHDALILPTVNGVAPSIFANIQCSQHWLLTH